ncbi:alpha/beta hydrolase family esterase [Sphingomonas sp. MMS12-HWE2-04]|uniref:extracellular catalytic domain type 1 short-chain-length polyhydroxyalkanoate depolymerase n=1 Tax=Sphingomonas sp. MMS12-HWE2-04 TaxID=3234199 RepID=UPI00384FFEC9
MRNLNDTITRLSALRGRIDGASGAVGTDRLVDLLTFGSNPGALRGRCHLPEGLGANAPLVVVLHGCTQDAGGYDHGSGWSHLADEQGFAVLFPEQQRANNANLCFNWFNAEDTRRGSGEPESIRQMIVAMIAKHRLDPARVYVTGLSAGGAMTSVMLATYPELFAGGAIIAGLPYGTARSVPEAFDRMRAHGGPDAAALGGLVAAASDHQGPWPRISVWHGDGDRTVSSANAALVVEQWRGLHGVAKAPDRTESVDGHPRSVWRNAQGRDVIEEYRIAGLGHGTPLSTFGDDACGNAAPYMLEAGISSTRHIARFWGISDAVARPATKSQAEPAQAPHGVTRVIEDALRAAGLMR